MESFPTDAEVIMERLAAIEEQTARIERGVAHLLARMTPGVLICVKEDGTADYRDGDATEFVARIMDGEASNGR